MVTIGIDPSLNSTGVCILRHNDDGSIDEKYFIIKPNKLTKRENDAQKSNPSFKYVLYDKQDLKQFKENNHVQEYHKTRNIINITHELKHIIDENVNNDERVIIVQEGISYGSSIRTKSIYDLAGLNYLIRNLFIDDERFELYVCPPSNIKKFASGNGNCKKELIVQLFTAIHKDFDIPKIDDIADAYFMAKYGEQIKKMSDK